MKSYRKIVVVIGCLGMISGAVGCANKDVVKKDEMLAVDKAPSDSASATVPTTNIQPLLDAKKDESKQEAIGEVRPTTEQPANMTAVNEAFEKVYFDFDSTDLNEEARNTLTHDAEILMKAQQGIKLLIEGHSDERGSTEYNLALGERRAKAAAKYLVTMGVQPERLSTISYGEEHPAVQGSNEEAWAKNRRDEFVIQK